MKHAFEIDILPLTATLVALEDAPLPLYLGSTLRGALGQALSAFPEAFAALFCGGGRAQGQNDAVNPYVITPPFPCRAPFHRCEALVFGLTLLGDATRHTRQVVQALAAWEQPDSGFGVFRKPFRLMEVRNTANNRRVWHSGTFFEAAASPSAIAYESLPGVTELELRLLTPLRIRRDGQVLRAFDFPTLIRNMTHRVERVAKHCGGYADSQEILRVQALARSIFGTKTV